MAEMEQFPENIFFSGIAGSGVSALAVFMAQRGHRVSGSDRQFDNGAGAHMLKTLRAAGIRIHPQDGSGITMELELMVLSTAVEDHRPEVVKAKEIGLKIQSRPEFLARLANGMKTIAMAGTSGKSSASGMLAHAMHSLGLSPNFIGGGRVKNLRTTANPGNVLAGSSDMLVIEADESDGSIVNYRPAHSVIANLALDHNPVEETAAMFSTLAAGTTGIVALNLDDKTLARALPMVEGKSIGYSIETPSDIMAREITLSRLGSSFSVNAQQFRLQVPGIHNIYNALGVIAMLSTMQVNPRDIAHALGSFRGIERRFDVHLDHKGILVVDDYAHNPHKISALLHTVQGVSGRTCCIFQPHGYGPLKLMLREYAATFNSMLRPGDKLFILPVYYGGGTTSKEITSTNLAELSGACAPADRTSLINEINTSPPDAFDCYTVFGARDDSLSELAGAIAKSVSNRLT